jgi:hypothetical protein
MATYTPTFVREGSQILAFFEDRVIASGTSFAKVEESAVDYLDNLSKERDGVAAEKKKSSATHIVTPSGLKGEILGRHDGQWGEKLITVRLENGRIARYEAHAGNDEKIDYQRIEAAQSESALEYLEKTLNEVPEGSKESLAHRITVLDGLVVKAGSVIQSGVANADEIKLNDIVIAAEHEKREVKEALEHLEQADAETFSPPAPYDFGVAEQADLGRSNGTWLDDTVDEMVAESEAQDFDKLLTEEPGQFVTELDTGALGDAAVTRELALSHIVSKTAGLRGEELEKYRSQFLAKVELARRDELKDRKQHVKEAAVAKEASDDFPDEALFS